MINDQETYAIIGAAQRVHAELRFGFYERIYQDALEIELQDSNIPHVREKAIDVFYKDKKLGESYFADFYCYDDIIVELKAINRLSKVEEAQVIHYMKATGKTRALLINFGKSDLEIRRFVNGYVYTDSASPTEKNS